MIADAVLGRWSSTVWCLDDSGSVDPPGDAPPLDEIAGEGMRFWEAPTGG